jgi:hypothetical protein
MTSGVRIYMGWVRVLASNKHWIGSIDYEFCCTRSDLTRCFNSPSIELQAIEQCIIIMQHVFKHLQVTFFPASFALLRVPSLLTGD